MSIADKFILFWMLPSLITFCVLTQCARVDNNVEPENYDYDDWCSCVFICIFYPVGLFIVIAIVMPWFIKERKWWWEK